MSTKNKNLVLIELNEINFDVVREYLLDREDRFPTLAKLLMGGETLTLAESKYEELEPWIQWASVHTVKAFDEHKIFRLGDVVNYDGEQIFEILEDRGYKVGAISAMNADNRLNQPAYFIPDPWTKTSTDGSWWSRALHSAVSQAVNDNSEGRVSLTSKIILALAMARFARPKNYKYYFRFLLNSRKKNWFKSLILDLLLHDIHWCLFHANKVNFSTLFLNAGAHIQHHYFFNAGPVRNRVKNGNPIWYIDGASDPLADVLNLYDLILRDYITMVDSDCIVATGLSQIPYDRVKYYYRLSRHEHFLGLLGIPFSSVLPRMTRDFLVEFENDADARRSQELLSNIMINNTDVPLFGEIDNRGKSIFVTLTYPYEITKSSFFTIHGRSVPLEPEVNFVAIKNGMHQAKGYAFFTNGIRPYAPKDMGHVKELGEAILKFFGVRT